MYDNFFHVSVGISTQLMLVPPSTASKFASATILMRFDVLLVFEKSVVAINHCINEK